MAMAGTLAQPAMCLAVEMLLRLMPVGRRKQACGGAEAVVLMLPELFRVVLR